MARIRQPRELAVLKGATKHDPQRYQNEVPTSEKPLGNAPEYMTDKAKATWLEIESLSIPGVLTGADRFLMEFAANTLAEYRDDPSKYSASKLGQLISIFARLGMSPADRQKVGSPSKPKGSGFDDLNYFDDI